MLSVPRVARPDADKNDPGSPGKCSQRWGRRVYVCRGQETEAAGATVPQNLPEASSSVSRGSQLAPQLWQPLQHIAAQLLGTGRGRAKPRAASACARQRS